MSRLGTFCLTIIVVKTKIVASAAPFGMPYSGTKISQSVSKVRVVKLVDQSPPGKGNNRKQALEERRSQPKGGKNARGRRRVLRVPWLQKVTLRRPNIRRFSTSMITGFTKSQIEKHIKSLQTDFSSSYTPQQLRMRHAKRLFDDDCWMGIHLSSDPVHLNLPDYSEIITRPMDLSTIKKNLESNKYKTPEAFWAHVRLVFENAIVQPGRGRRAYYIKTPIEVV